MLRLTSKQTGNKIFSSAFKTTFRKLLSANFKQISESPANFHSKQNQKIAIKNKNILEEKIHKNKTQGNSKNNSQKTIKKENAKNDFERKIDSLFGQKMKLVMSYKKFLGLESKLNNSGQGFYQNYLAKAIFDYVLRNPDWSFSHELPLIPEACQGRLELLYHLQNCVTSFTQMPYCSVAFPDLTNALLTAVKILSMSGSQSGTILFAPSIFQYLKTDIDYFALISKSKIIICGDDFEASVNAYKKELLGVVLQSPDKDGIAHDYSDLVDKVHLAGGKVILITDLFASAVCKSPGEVKADIAVGSLQRLGAPMSRLGPHGGFLAFSKELLSFVSADRAIKNFNEKAEAVYFLTPFHAKHARISENLAFGFLPGLSIYASAFYVLYFGGKILKEKAVSVHQKTIKIACFLTKNDKNKLLSIAKSDSQSSVQSKKVENAESPNENGSKNSPQDNAIPFVNFYDTFETTPKFLFIKDIKKYLKSLTSPPKTDPFSITINEPLNSVLLSDYLAFFNYKFSTEKIKKEIPLPSLKIELARKSQLKFKDNFLQDGCQNEKNFLEYVNKIVKADFDLNGFATRCFNHKAPPSYSQKLGEFLSFEAIDWNPVLQTQSSSKNFFYQTLTNFLGLSCTFLQKECMNFGQLTREEAYIAALWSIEKSDLQNENAGKTHWYFLTDFETASFEKVKEAIGKEKITVVTKKQIAILEKINSAENQEGSVNILIRASQTFWLKSRDLSKLIERIRGKGGRVVIDASDYIWTDLIKLAKIKIDVLIVDFVSSFQLKLGVPSFFQVSAKKSLQPFLRNSLIPLTEKMETRTLDSLLETFSWPITTLDLLLNISNYLSAVQKNSIANFSEKLETEIKKRTQFLSSVLKQEFKNYEESDAFGIQTGHVVVDLSSLLTESQFSAKDLLRRLMDFEVSGCFDPDFLSRKKLRFRISDDDDFMKLKKFATALIAIKKDLSSEHLDLLERKKVMLKSPYTIEATVIEQKNNLAWSDMESNKEIFKAKKSGWPSVQKIKFPAEFKETV